ncbi:hypothetical protein Cfor_01040 [Coptotermes formosanus]|uniref:MULE transposase domain-containing protein n=1 Tax=Coptotermes formosanus TaxID=36987 RepID=A0A6L2Q155_COPFO|nr:hypothetical protein Cfor_01040 [Coptotermes formosanus]
MRLNTVSRMYMDGTSECCPRYFYQLCATHGLVNNVHIPLVFAIFSDKTSNTSIRLLNKLKDLGVSPSVFVIDFENATKTATETVFPHSIIQGCRFHLPQTWCRKMQQLGLAKQYIAGESEVGK